MSNKRKVEIFSAGCPACDDAVEMVKRIACPSCETEVLDVLSSDAMPCGTFAERNCGDPRQ